jgi:hypothetical protein
MSCGFSFPHRYVDENAFSGLRILIDLDLSYNDIPKLKLKTFEDNPNLQVISGHDPVISDLFYIGLSISVSKDVSKSSWRFASISVSPTKESQNPGLFPLCIGNDRLENISGKIKI